MEVTAELKGRLSYMLIEKQYIQELLDLLGREQAIGNAWVAYTQEPYPDKSIHFFKYEAEVKNFCITATKSIDESVTKAAYFIRRTQDLNLAVLKGTEQARKDGDFSDLHVIGLPVDYNVEAIVVKGIYLPDLKRVIDDTLWHEYKDMGLNWDNRHSSKWWELNGSYLIDRIDRDISTLLEDQRTKNIVEQLIGKDYLGYFDRSVIISDEQRAKIELQLADYPFVEFNNPKRKLEIIESLGKGESTWMTLEKVFYPAPEISQYIVFEHLYPEGMVYEHGHSLRKLHTSTEFANALEYLQVNAIKHLEVPNKRVSELLLIGQYRDKELLFNYEGLPESHTGLQVATGWKNGNNQTELIFNHIPHTPILIKETFFVSLDDAGTLRFHDGVNDREIDLSFWKPGDESVKAYVVRQEHLRLPFTNNLVEQYFETIYSNLKFKAMNVENANFMKNQTRYMGHGEMHYAKIDESLRTGMKDFTSTGEHLFYQGNRKLTTTLNFNQKNPNELHFWNSYDATLKNPQGEETKQRFYINQISIEDPDTHKIERRTVGFTTKEACNLLDKDHKGNSRAVYKEYYTRDGQPYMGWKKLDLNAPLDKHENHPVISYSEFDLKKVVAGHKIQENLDDVVKSLNKGNLQAVTTPEGARQYFAADPANKDVIKYDNNLKLIYQNSQEARVVNVIPEKNTSQGQDTNPGQQLPTPANGEQKAVPAPEQSPVDKDQEPLLSNGATNQSQDGKGENQSKKNNQEVGDNEPLIKKGNGKKGSKKDVTADGEPPSKKGPSRGKGGEEKLLEKNGTTTKKGMGVK